MTVTLALLLGGCGEDIEDLARASLSQLDGEIALSGLERPVEIRRDPWGVAHIYAESVDDLFFTQGFVAAQDRLWQLEIWRRIGEGRLAEVVGPEAVERDRLARLLAFRGDWDAEWTSYHPEAKRIVSAFVRGINAFIEHRRDNLPVEFKLTGVMPDPWTPEVPLLRMAGLPMTQNATDEIRLAASAAELGVAEANRRDAPDPWHRLRIPQGLDPASVPREVLDILREGYQPIPEIPIVERYRPLVGVAEPDERLAGSNNWVVAGPMTSTGMPILANDPHRRIELPSLRYLVHLNGPGWNVIGAGEPALPGVAIGHNERIAWGLTVVGIDQQDVFVERVNPENRNEVWHDGRWVGLTVEVDTIGVLDEPPRVVELKFGPHGPIVYEDTVRHRAFAFRSVLAEPGTAGYLGSLRLGQASSWEEFLAAMDHWLVPSENMIYADVEGNIGWQAAGLAPVRCCGWVGRLPAPGWGNFDWHGFRPMRELPREFNPTRGYIATANHNIMPEGFEPPLGYSWSHPRRYRRIDAVLSDSGGFSVEDFERLQHDVRSQPAIDVVQVLGAVEAPNERWARAREMLVSWDGLLHRDSAAPALYRAWRDTLDARALRPAPSPQVRDSLLIAALDAAVSRLEAEQGTDWENWEYGRIWGTEFRHAVSDAFSLPRVPKGGDGTTVNLTGQWGASFREILDVSNWDRSVAINVPGQSGQPGSPYYDNLVPLWANGEYFPLLFSREAVEGHTAHLLRLTPANR